jgi:hypothetical protein
MGRAATTMRGNASGRRVRIQPARAILFMLFALAGCQQGATNTAAETEATVESTTAESASYCKLYDDTEADYQSKRGDAATEYSFGETTEMFRTRAADSPIEQLRQDWMLLADAVALNLDFDRPSVKQSVDDATDRIDAYNAANCGFESSGDAAHRFAVDYIERVGRHMVRRRAPAG